ncbi:M20 family metallopeptidase [Amycolatopsis cihanbeyliensis]|uniref:Acetylornithine deacetylase/succinyl-diaminopimelate desuccinylase-like protein n=1 Tax=Amycolatopsis cihanbeyliensis TaxID=1128664 RepID=A0A542DR69_AMYCI|nr:peptidase dimerization domain-containing protein [Amycolatopsis cihanbeyliensis]TQJ05580.1 acetylornithine deacetylase/succinyl-diaminopimelate desuccinylase-like protein [Amycolatopsis cihanbeyliensis]
MSAPDGLAGLDARRREWTQRAWREVDADRLRELISGLVDIPSPTGDEAALAEYAADVLGACGIESRVQPLDERQANAVGRLGGTGSGPDLLLYAPVDTVTTGAESKDLPWAGSELRQDMRPRAVSRGDHVFGLGASNPKGHAACVLAAAEAIRRADLELSGDLLVALGAGGMPTTGLEGNPRRNIGHGAGCSFLLEQGGWPDFAVIAKPGWTVSWEEVGLAWFEVEVHGTHTYVGSRHRLPYSNAVELAGRLARGLEQWFPEYTARHSEGLVAPQGVVAAVEGGTPRTAAFTPASCRLLVDLRLSPRTTPAEARRELAGQVRRFAAELGAKVRVRQVLAIPGVSTDPHSWICRTAIEAWQAFEAAEHVPVTDNSGATDANILRGRGVPTVRIGMPKVDDMSFPMDFQLGMNTVDVRQAEKLTRHLVRVAVDTVCRSRAEVGLG